MRSPRHAWPLWLLVAWGVILFGAVYPWAYIPLLDRGRGDRRVRVVELAAAPP